MSRQSIWSPLSLLAAGLVVIAVLLVGPDTRIDAGRSLNQSYPSPSTYPGPGSRTPTTTATLGTSAPTTSSTPGAGTPTATSRLATPTPTGVPGDQLDTQTAPADSPTETPEETATPTLTPTPLGDLQCAPGVPVEISGEGPPRAPYLLYFADRVVSGGSVDPSGRFSIALIVGSERAGTYEVTVRVRGTTQVLRQLSCSVPPTTPTPLPTSPLR